MIQTLSRRKLLGGLGLLIAAPAIVKASSLMPVKAYPADVAMPIFDTPRVITNVDYPKVIWSGVRKWWGEEFARMEGGLYLNVIAAEPLRAGQPVVLR